MSAIERLLRAAVLAVLLVVPVFGASSARAADLVVFAAASLKNALDGVAAGWKATGKGNVAISYAGSPALARQIEHGAPADLFLSADLDWMDHVAARNLIRPGSRTTLLGNRLVLIAPADRARPIEIRPGFPLAERLGDGRLAMADTGAVPAGKYGKAALESLGVWNTVSGRVAQSENVRAALLFVARGEAPLGIVYRTDAAAEPRVAVVGTFPEDSHPPILYPAAVTAASKHPDAAAFLAFLRSPEARKRFEAEGFVVLPERP